jgi:hypothetical protein
MVSRSGEGASSAVSRSFDRCIEAKMMMGLGRVVGGDVSGGVRSSAVLMRQRMRVGGAGWWGGRWMRAACIALLSESAEGYGE